MPTPWDNWTYNPLAAALLLVEQAGESMQEAIVNMRGSIGWNHALTKQAAAALEALELLRDDMLAGPQYGELATGNEDEDDNEETGETV